MTSTQIYGVLGAVIMASLILRLVVRRKLLVKYSVMWLFIGVALVVLALIPHSVANLSNWLGFALPQNLIFFAGFILVLAVAVQICVELTRVERRIQRLAEEVALLREATENRPRPNGE